MSENANEQESPEFKSQLHRKFSSGNVASGTVKLKNADNP